MLAFLKNSFNSLRVRQALPSLSRVLKVYLSPPLWYLLDISSILSTNKNFQSISFPNTSFSYIVESRTMSSNNFSNQLQLIVPFISLSHILKMQSTVLADTSMPIFLKAVSIYVLETSFEQSLSIIWNAFLTVMFACLMALNSRQSASSQLFRVMTPLLLIFRKNSLYVIA